MDPSICFALSGSCRMDKLGIEAIEIGGVF